MESYVRHYTLRVLAVSFTQSRNLSQGIDLSAVGASSQPSLHPLANYCLNILSPVILIY